MNALSGEPIAHPDEPRDFTIIGSGVVGVLTANQLADKGHSVRVLSNEGIPTMWDHSTSSMAIGQFLPWVPEEHEDAVLGNLPLEEVVSLSRSFYEALARNPHETGVMPVRNIEFVRSANPWPGGLQQVMRVRRRELEKPVTFTEPTGEETTFDTELSFDTFSINARKAIAYLARRALDQGVRFERRHVSRQELERLEGVVINAAGMGAPELDPSQAIKGFKGHSFVVKPHSGYALPSEALSCEDLVMMPREDGTAICGALYIENPDRPVPEAEEASELMTRLGSFFSETAGTVKGLKADFLDNVEVLIHSAGYRMEAQDGGIRVMPDEKNTRLLHAYGFGGIGWSVGPHFAEKISNLAIEMRQNLKEK